MTPAALASEEARGAGLRLGSKRRIAGIGALLAGAIAGGFLAVETALVWPLVALLAIHLGAAGVLLRRRPPAPI
jgi:hypothetical protein